MESESVSISAFQSSLACIKREDARSWYCHWYMPQWRVTSTPGLPRSVQHDYRPRSLGTPLTSKSIGLPGKSNSSPLGTADIPLLTSDVYLCGLPCSLSREPVHRLGPLYRHQPMGRSHSNHTTRTKPPLRHPKPPTARRDSPSNPRPPPTSHSAHLVHRRYTGGLKVKVGPPLK